MVSTSQTSIKTFSAGRGKRRERAKEIQATSHLSHHKKPLVPGLHVLLSQGEAKERGMRICQIQTTKRCCLTHPSSACPLQYQWHHLNHLNPPKHDPWQVTHHSNARTSLWDSCWTAYLAENINGLTVWFIQNYSSMVLLHSERSPIVHRGPGN